MSAPTGPSVPQPNPDGQLLIYRDGGLNLQVRLDGQTVWLTQAAMAELFQTTPQNITMHVATIYEEGELSEEATCKEYLQVRAEGNRQVQRLMKHYSLDVVLAVGYRVRSPRGTQFRQWATVQLRDLLVKGSGRRHRATLRRSQTNRKAERRKVHQSKVNNSGNSPGGSLDELFRDCS